MTSRTAVLLGAVGIVANVVALFYALAPGFVTYVPKSPPIAKCDACARPEVQTALLQAVSFGQSQIQGLVQSAGWWVIAAIAMNTAILLAVIWGLRSNSTPHTDARASSVLNEPPSARAGERGR